MSLSVSTASATDISTSASIETGKLILKLGVTHSLCLGPLMGSCMEFHLDNSLQFKDLAATI
jgi:hypothetical protein